MGLINGLKEILFEDIPDDDFEDSGTEAVRAESSSGFLNDTCAAYSNLWQYELALNSVANLLYAVLSDAKWNTYDIKGKQVNNEVYFALNYSPNKRQTASEFWRQFSQKLIFKQKVLIVETADNQLYIADTWDFKDGEEMALKQNTFTNVTIGNVSLNRSFKEGYSAIYIKLPMADSTNRAMTDMQADYNNLKSIILKGALKAMGTKYNINLSSVKHGSQVDQKYLDSTATAFKTAMDQPNSIFFTFAGETLQDMTEDQRGSEVEQILKVVENNVAINKEIVSNVARAYSIPVSFMTAEITTDNADAMGYFMTMFVKPILTMLAERFTLFYIKQENIVQGAKISCDMQSISYIDVLTKANAMDKLLSSGVYTINELRQKIGDDPVENGDIRYITKNYASLEQQVKGGSDG